MQSSEKLPHRRNTALPWNTASVECSRLHGPSRSDRADFRGRRPTHFGVLELARLTIQEMFTAAMPGPAAGENGWDYGRKRVGPSVAKAGLPYDFEYPFEGGLGGLLPTLPPEPVQFPRKPLDLKFAVLLMRSSYEATDDLDFIPMDQFQAKFWKLRQSEVEPYTIQYSPLKIRAGELTDPLYFDFISFAQYATISNAMSAPLQVFQEREGAFGEAVTVRRDVSLHDDAMLPKTFKQVVGRKIYAALLNGFEDVTLGGPAPCQPGDSFNCVLEGVRTILNIFVKQGYALSASVAEVGEASDGKHSFKVKVEGPATLWGLRALASRRAAVLTDYEAMAISGFLEASNTKFTYKSKFSDTAFEQQWTIS